MELLVNIRLTRLHVCTLNLKLNENEGLEGNWTFWPEFYFKLNTLGEMRKMVAEVPKDSERSLYKGSSKVTSDVLQGKWVTNANVEADDLNSKLSLTVFAGPMLTFPGFLVGGIKFSCIQFR